MGRAARSVPPGFFSDQQFAASEARFGVWVEPGLLWQNTAVRLRPRDCEATDCWEAKDNPPRLNA